MFDDIRYFMACLYGLSHYLDVQTKNSAQNSKKNIFYDALGG